MRLLIPVSYFKSLPRSEIWSLDTSTGARTLVFAQATPAPLAVNGKGITGLDWLDARHLVACDFNRVLCIRRTDGEVRASRHHSLFNDLHAVTVQGDYIGVCNTGLDAIDWLDQDLVPLRRQPLLSRRATRNRVGGHYRRRGGYYDPPTAVPDFTRRKVPDRWHLNHLVRCAGHWLGTAFRRRAVVEVCTTRASWLVCPANWDRC